jgi:hypothetical protein
VNVARLICARSYHFVIALWRAKTAQSPARRVATLSLLCCWRDIRENFLQYLKEIAALTVELKEQRALIQKVSDKVELNKPAPQVVNNP